MKFTFPKLFARQPKEAEPAPVQEAPAVQAASGEVPMPPMPKARSGQRGLPSYTKSAKPDTKVALRRDDAQLINKDLTTLRSSGGTLATIRAFARASPDLSAAVTTPLRVGITDGYTLYAKNPDGTFNREATKAAHQLAVRLDLLSDPTKGFDDAMSVRSLAEAWGKELMLTGAIACELVLDKARLPDKIQPISSSQIEMRPSSDGKRLVPWQRLAGKEIELNVPTFFMLGLDQDLLSPYADSPLESAMQPTLAGEQLMADLRRVLQRAIHPRLLAVLQESSLRDNLPPEVAQNPDDIEPYLLGLISQVQESLDSLNPEQALVLMDTIKVEVMDHGNTNLAAEWETLMSLINSRLATGTKTLPTILGHSNGTSSTASAEVLLYVKQVEGTVWSKVNEMMSKVLTLAVRLSGHDVYVSFRQSDIDLRPKSELEAFFVMRQSRVLDLLSLGMISDDEACIRLTGNLPPDAYKPLSGTMFRAGAGSVTPAGDGYNGASNSGSAMNQNLNPDTPTGKKGSQANQPGQPAAGIARVK